ncbi:MAG: hypothetical protein WAM84_07795, partial [Candidatus Cybelea sp.]
MRHEERRGLEFAHDPHELTLKCRTSQNVDGSERLVHQQRARSRGNRARNPNPLRLSAGKLTGATIAIGRRLETDQRKQFVHTLGDLRAAPALQRWDDRDILRDAHVSEESDRLYDVTDAAAQLDRVEFGDVAPVHHDPSPGERHQTVDG